MEKTGQYKDTVRSNSCSGESLPSGKKTKKGKQAAGVSVGGRKAMNECSNVGWATGQPKTNEKSTKKVRFSNQTEFQYGLSHTVLKLYFDLEMAPGLGRASD